MDIEKATELTTLDFSNTTNFSNSDSLLTNTTAYSNRDELLASIEIAVQTIILLLAIVGNSIVLLVLFLRKGSFSRMHLLMAHLSFADLFVALCSVLPQLVWDVTYVFYGGDILCRIVKYLQVVAIYGSAYVLVMTAVDRYIAIVHPFYNQKMSSKRVHMMICAAWGLSLLFSTPQLFIFSMKDRGDGTQDCWATFEPQWTLEFYIITFTLSVYIIPTVILTVCYGRICFTVWRRSHIGERISNSDTNTAGSNQAFVKMRSNCSIQSNSGRISRTKMKTVQMTLAVVLCYLLCWSPFFIFQIWGVYDEAAFLSSAVFAISLLLASLNSCTNPWIYLLFSERAVGTCQKYLACRTS